MKIHQTHIRKVHALWRVDLKIKINSPFSSGFLPGIPRIPGDFLFVAPLFPTIPSVSMSDSSTPQTLNISALFSWAVTYARGSVSASMKSGAKWNKTRVQFHKLFCTLRHSFAPYDKLLCQKKLFKSWTQGTSCSA